MKLNLGSGSKRHEGYTNIDIDGDSNPDYVLDIGSDKWPFEDNSVDAVIAHHIFEHMGDEFFHCMQELYRVCKHGTIVHVRVPHPRHDTFLIDPTHRRPIYPHTLDMFSQKRNQRDIERGGTETPIGRIYKVDFEVLRFDYVLDEYWLPKFQQMTEEECEHVARSMNNVILEIDIKMMVIKDEFSKT